MAEESFGDVAFNNAIELGLLGYGRLFHRWGDAVMYSQQLDRDILWDMVKSETYLGKFKGQTVWVREYRGDVYFLDHRYFAWQYVPNGRCPGEGWEARQVNG